MVARDHELERRDDIRLSGGRRIVKPRQVRDIRACRLQPVRRGLVFRLLQVLVRTPPKRLHEHRGDHRLPRQGLGLPARLVVQMSPHPPAYSWAGSGADSDPEFAGHAPGLTPAKASASHDGGRVSERPRSLPARLRTPSPAIWKIGPEQLCSPIVFIIWRTTRQRTKCGRQKAADYVLYCGFVLLLGYVDIFVATIVMDALNRVIPFPFHAYLIFPRFGRDVTTRVSDYSGVN
jgi:hypothetical protein